MNCLLLTGNDDVSALTVVVVAALHAPVFDESLEGMKMMIVDGDDEAKQTVVVAFPFAAFD
jgi:hypothetical protein